MSKDSAQSRIPRFDSVGSRIPVPGTFRLPAASRLSAVKRSVPSTPISFLRPPGRTAGTVARSYSGDKLSGIGGAPSPFPVLTASSTPAPGPRPTSVATPFLRKLDAVEATVDTDVGASSERLEDIKLCQREFGLPSDDDEDLDGQQQDRADEDDEYLLRTETTILANDPDGDSEPAVQMLVDESLELVGAHSTDNLLDPPATAGPTAGGSQQQHLQQQYINPHEPSVTLLRDGNVTYEIRRSATFLKSSHESLNGSGPERARRPVMDSTQSYPHAGGLTFRRESTASIDSPLLLDLTRTMALRRRPSTGELLTDDDEDGCGLKRSRRPGVLNSTMVHERLLNVTQSIPDITQELATAGRLGSPFLVQVQDQNGLGRAKKPNRLTFSNAEESQNLMYFSDITEGPRMGTMGPLNSTMHGGPADSLTIAPPGSGPPVIQSELSPGAGRSMLLQDTLGSQDQTLVAMDFDGDAVGEDEYAADRRRLNEKLELAGDTASVGDVSAGKEIFDLSLDEPPVTPDEEEANLVVLRRRSSASTSAAGAIVPPRQRYSFGLDLTECTLDCSIELCDSSLSPTKPPPPGAMAVVAAAAGGPHLKSPTSSLCHGGSLTKQGSFEMDESLGILTPDQMKEFLDSTTTNTTNNTGNGNGLELHLNTGASSGAGAGGGAGMMMHHHKHGGLQHHCRIDQTPSPEELPLDPVGVKTDMSGILLPAELLLMSSASGIAGSGVGGVAGGSGAGRSTTQGEVSQTSDSDPKTDQMSKSGTSSKVSNSFITSITSITSLDTGYQGDGEMSRPASRGADHSPSNGPRRDVPVAKGAGAGGGWQPLMVAAIAVVPRRQDPMTDSDFFTESDADDVFNRGDARRAQIIDGQLYGAGSGAGTGVVAGGGGVAAVGAAIPGGANVGIFPDVLPGLGGAGGGPVGDGGGGPGGPNGGDDSCMESSGIFTDVENRADDDLVQRRADDQLGRRAMAVDGGGEETEMDLSPADTSSDTISSSNSQNFGDRGAAAAPGGSILCGEMNSSASSGLSANHRSEASEPNAPNPNAGDDAHCDGKCPGVGEASPVATATEGSSIARRSDGGSGSLTVRSTPGGSNGKRASCGANSNRKQTKPSTESAGRAAFVRKHAAAAMMSAADGRRVERLSKARLFQDSPPEGSRDGVPFEDAPSSPGCASGDGGGDQENKRPPAGSRLAAGGVVRATVNLSFVKKSGSGTGGAGGAGGGTPNKWDAVMSKIAENKKSVPRKCFGEVKSRVNCGTVGGGGGGRLTRAVAPSGSTGIRSPPSEAASITSRGSTVSKRTVSGSVKRGRTQSKDSQQSSQSDLSLSGGSPKLTPKVSSTRPAKKRDVRTINSSSSDLGPPPSKTNGTQTTRSSAARVAAVLQKRISPSLTSSASIPLVPEQLKASPPSKRNLLLKRSGTANNGTLPVKTPLKGKLAAHIVKDGNKENSIAGDHNRLVGASPATTKSAATVAPTATHSPKPATKSLIRATATSNTATANLQQAAQHNHAAGSNGVTTTTTVKAIQRNGTIILDKSSTPLLIGDGTPEAPVTGAGGKKNGPAATGEQQQPAANGGGEPNCDHRRDRTAIRSDREPAQPSSIAGGAKLVDASLLNHAQKGVEALGVLVQYLVFNLDAFSCPTIKTAHQKTTHDLLETKTMLDDARTDGQTLKQQLLETTARETELQELHRCELSRVESCLTEQQRNADDRIAALEVQLHEKESRVRELLARIDDYQIKLSSQAESARLRELDLLQRINALSCTENELRDKVHSSELAFSERLQAAAMRERDLTEQVNSLTRDQERIRRETEQKERELEEKLSITKDECVVLRQSRNSFAAMDVSATGAAASPQPISIPLQLNRSSGNINHLQVLQDEVESLRCVLDLKQREISELRKQTQQYERDAKDLPGALVKISGLESRIEDLQVQLKTKTEEEKELQQKLKHLQDNLCQESKIKTRLSLHNEELQWRLKQNSEKFTLAYAELSKSYHENSSCMMLNTSKSSLDHSAPATAGGGGGCQQQQHASSAHQLSHTGSRSSCSDRFFDMDDISPPTSPVIKGMVEKSDSVSWVLEIDDEPPEVSASRMVRRAGSFRSSAAYTESVAKRPKCTALSQSNGCGAGIQQSTSATSILRQHSSDMSPTKPASGGICSPVSAVSQRLRSKSVSIKAVEPPKKIVRSNSGASTTAVLSASKPVRMPHELGGSSWKEQPLYSSSPYAHKRYLSEDNELLVAGTSKQTFGEQQPHRTKDLFLEETELLSEPESPFPTRRRPQSPMNGGGEVTCVVDMPVEVFHRDKTPNFKKSKENRGLITCDTTALTGSPKLSNGGAGTVTAREKRREFTRKSNGSATNGSSISRPLEAAGEALVSGANSDDEASSSGSVSSSSSSSSASSSSSSSCLLSEEGSLSCGSSDGRSPVHATLQSGSISGKRSSERMHGDGDMAEGKVPKEHRHHHRHHRRRHSNVSLEDALMKKIVASLNGGDAGSANGDGAEGNDTPMEVSWSEDGDPGSESIV